MPHTPETVLRFWFDELAPAQWWKADPALDHTVTTRFGTLHRQALHGELLDWREHPHGRLAEVIVLDQFSRNMHRGQPRAFEADPMALALAQTAVTLGADLHLTPQERAFLYMPYMHSESPRIHTLAVPLFRDRATDGSHASELQHKAIIDRFGRYPHRNAILGRISSVEEQVFLELPGSGF